MLGNEVVRAVIDAPHQGERLYDGKETKECAVLAHFLNDLKSVSCRWARELETLARNLCNDRPARWNEHAVYRLLDGDSELLRYALFHSSWFLICPVNRQQLPSQLKKGIGLGLQLKGCPKDGLSGRHRNAARARRAGN